MFSEGFLSDTEIYSFSLTSDAKDISIKRSENKIEIKMSDPYTYITQETKIQLTQTLNGTYHLKISSNFTNYKSNLIVNNPLQAELFCANKTQLNESICKQLAVFNLHAREAQVGLKDQPISSSTSFFSLSENTSEIEDSYSIEYEKFLPIMMYTIEKEISDNLYSIYKFHNYVNFCVYLNEQGYILHAINDNTTNNQLYFKHAEVNCLKKVHNLRQQNSKNSTKWKGSAELLIFRATGLNVAVSKWKNKDKRWKQDINIKTARPCLRCHKAIIKHACRSIKGESVKAVRFVENRLDGDIYRYSIKSPPKDSFFTICKSTQMWRNSKNTHSKVLNEKVRAFQG